MSSSPTCTSGSPPATPARPGCSRRSAPRGYTGSFPNVRDYVRRLRLWAAASPGQAFPPTVREVTQWITRHGHQLDQWLTAAAATGLTGAG